MSSASTSRAIPPRSDSLAVFAGGCLGALTRAAVAEAIPGVWATLLVNVVGSFILGAVVTRSPRLWGTGFCGALTTFSTLSVQLLDLQPAAAVAYAVGSVVLGYAAVDLGAAGVIAWVGLALAGGLGAVARLMVTRALPIPYGTLAVNVTGAFALGLLGANFVVGTGFVGAYTTFSTWMLESHQLSHRAALANLVGSLALGLAAAQVGIEVRLAG